MDKVVTRATMTVTEAARLLGIGRETAYHQARTGRLGPVPVYRIGRRLVVPRRALERALAGELAGYEPTTTRRSYGGTRRCPHCGPVEPVPYPADPDDPAQPGDRCSSCGYAWPGGAPCVE